ncbi:hypothetical protein Tco_1082066 [Tanacetum coccineum]|uniref:Uncharacterized protein n=1 Tax=Tanacetum coccineum TaxID=301880 RepID=A0ABQ5I0H8_9ASTR
MVPTLRNPNTPLLGAAPSYVFIRDPVRRLCHRMISCSISDRGQALEKAWVAPGPERQLDAVAGAPKDAPAINEGAQADPAPMQAPQPPPPTPRTMPQRIARLEDEVQELRRSIMRLRGDVDRSIIDQGRFTTWMVSCMTQLMDASGCTYQAFDNTLVGSSQLPYQRRTRRRTGDACTSAPLQPDP